MMENRGEPAISQLIGHLKELEYAIRQSITVREDQEEDAELRHRDEAERYGIRSDASTTKGDLLNTVQTALRSAEAKAGKNKAKV